MASAHESAVASPMAKMLVIRVHHVMADSDRVRKRISPIADIDRMIDAHTDASITVEAFPFRAQL